ERWCEMSTGEVAKLAVGEVPPRPPVPRVIDSFFEGPLRRDAEPIVPVEVRRNRIGTPRAVTDGQPAHRAVLPRVDLHDLADRTVVDELHGGAIGSIRLNLIAHLSDDAV